MGAYGAYLFMVRSALCLDIALAAEGCCMLVDLLCASCLVLSLRLQGIAADIADRFTIVTEHLIVAPSDNLPAAAQPHALRVALQQLATLQVAPVAAVQLSLQWQWSEALVAAAAAETAALSHLGCDMRLSAQALTDQLLGWLLEAGPLIKQVCVLLVQRGVLRLAAVRTFQLHKHAQDFASRSLHVGSRSLECFHFVCNVCVCVCVCLCVCVSM